jgi:hypothetical protein
MAPMVGRISGRLGCCMTVDRNAYSSHENLVTIIDAEVWMRKKYMTSILPSQSDDFVVEYVERKALSHVSFVVGLKEVVPTPEEVPSMICTTGYPAARGIRTPHHLG